jgi:hypothetical protein
MVKMCLEKSATTGKPLFKLISVNVSETICCIKLHALGATRGRFVFTCFHRDIVAEFASEVLLVRDLGLTQVDDHMM